MDNSKLIREDDVVILNNGENMKVFPVKRDKKIFIDKSKFILNAIIGERYGSRFKYKEDGLMKIRRNDSSESSLSGMTRGADNRELCANTENQKLSQDDIEKMKHDGTSGEKIIEQLIENSTTFKTKTEFSQEKYVKKKKTKHAVDVLNFSQQVLDTLYSFPLERLSSLDVTRAQLLMDIPERTVDGTDVGDEHTHVVSGMNEAASWVDAEVGKDESSRDVVIKNEDTEFATAVKVVDELHYDLDADEKLDENVNLDENVDKDKLCENVSKRLVGDVDDCQGNGDVEMVDAAAPQQHVCGTDGTDRSSLSASQASSKITHVTKKIEAKKKAEGNILEAQKILFEAKIDCLIVVSKYDPAPIVMALYKYIAPARPIVVHCQHQEPLMILFRRLKEDKMGVNVRLTENWFRHYQVLPERTHPHVNMSGTGGFLLSATTISPDSP